MIVFGTSLYGKTDEVAGVCWVATEFFHLWYFPLVPLKTWVVVSQQGKAWEGRKTAMSLRSVLLGWARGLSATGMIGAFFATMILYREHNSNLRLLIPAGVFVVGAALFGLTRLRWLRMASTQRTIALMNALGVAVAGVCTKCGLKLPRHVVRHCPDCGEAIATPTGRESRS